MGASLFTICIATRNRPQCLSQCLNSLILLNDLSFEIIIIDDASETSYVPAIVGNVRLKFRNQIQFYENTIQKGYIYNRNEMAKRAQTSYLLSLDDDAKLMDAGAIYKALYILKEDTQIGAIAFPQANENGTLLPLYMQPAPVTYAAYVPSFRGYGNIIRRDLFLRLGGYREIFFFSGEEDEYCKRMLNEGFHVVYLPNSKVIHSHSQLGRDHLMGLRYAIRSKCFDAILNEPFPMLILSIPFRILNYMINKKKLCEERKILDKAGIKWLLKELFRNVICLWRQRQPLKWKTYFHWTYLKRKAPPYKLA